MHIVCWTLFAFTFSMLACAQDAKPDEAALGPVVRISAPGESIKQLWAYADPSDDQHLIACGSFAHPQLEHVWQGYLYSSADAGATWHRTLLDDATRWVSEVSCTYGQEGAAYFVAGESDTSTGKPRHPWGHLQLFTSQDHGMTWTRAGRRQFCRLDRVGGNARG